MLMKYGAGTNKGKVRERNEDNNIVLGPDENGVIVFAVADGMGGMDFGDLASKKAIEVVEEMQKAGVPPKKKVSGFIDAIFSEANKRIIKECCEKKSLYGMGTTLSFCITYKDGLAVGHIGDSRIYTAGSDGIRQITKDHSYVEDLIDSGRITREQAKHHPNRNFITRALGIDLDIVPDIFESDISGISKILLCTDGLSNAVEDEEIFEIINSTTQPQEAVDKLIDLANERGGKDNITVQLAYMEE